LGKNVFIDFPQVVKEDDYSVSLGYNIVRLPRLSENGSSYLFPVFWVVSKVQELGVYPEKHL
jgi:hypothetical protein